MPNPPNDVRRSNSLAVLVCTFTLAALGAETTQPSATPAVSVPATRPVTAEEQLEQRLPKFVLKTASLREAIEVLRDRSGANIFVNWRAVHDGGAEPDDPVALDLNLRDVTLRQVLEKVLDAMPASPNADLGCAVRDGIITVSTRESLGRDGPVLRVYDISDVLSVTGPLLDLDEPYRDIWEPAPDDTPEQAERRRGFAVLRLLVHAIRPQEAEVGDGDSSVGGGEAHYDRAQLWRDRLLVVVTPEGHEKVAEFLKELRAVAESAKRPQP